MSALVLSGYLAINPSPSFAQCQPACNKQNVECLNPSPEYTNSRFVGRLTFPGGCCTGWIVAAPDCILTNNHCVPANVLPGQALPGYQINFTHECTACVGGVLKAPTTFNITVLLARNVNQDWALLRVGGNVAAAFGQASIDSTVATVGMGVYEVHQAECAPKGFDDGTVTGLFQNVGCPGNIPEHAVSIISSQGASGSPVFKSSNHCVTGICNCGPPCAPGFILPMSTIWPNILAAINAAGCTAIECAQGCPPADHNCYETGGPGCTNPSCCAQVCSADPFCCSNAWDGICVNEALTMCGNCGNPNNGSCAAAHATPGCNNSVCCAAICAIDPFCCDTQWDNICVGEANEICFGCGGISTGSCLVAHPTAACDNQECCKAVCAVDPFCCSNQWDNICVGEAQDLCLDCGGPLTEDCFTVHSTRSCEIPECCDAVCAVDSFCCTNQWDSICVGEAQDICAACGGAGAGSCQVAHPNPSCNNSLCCQTVCAVDAFCCDVEWDGICANEGIELCTGCGGVNSGSCFSTHAATCNNGTCCASVCAIDAFCCNTSWDSICVNEAEDLCGCPGDIAPTNIGGDGVINTADLLQVINTWGLCSDCPADLVPPGNNGVVNTADLLYIINHWGPCPGCGNPFICGEPAGQPVCGAGPPCFCWQGFYGDTVCAQNSICDGLVPCPDGVCPPGFVCITNTCCNGGAALCLPVCSTLLDTEPQGTGPTANGEIWGPAQK